MSVPYYGDFAEDDTVLIPLNTFDSNDPAASVTVTDLVDADIKVHKDGSTTEIATDGASVTIDFDTITGNHLITIDTSVHADYSTGSEYAVRLEGITVDAATLNVWVGAFSIERAGGALALLKNATYGLSAIETLVDELETRLTAARAGYLDNINGHTAQTGDNFARLGAPAGASVSADVAAVKAETANILIDTGTTLDGKIDTIDSNVDAILVDTGTTLDGKINTISTNTTNIENDTQDIQSRLPAALVTGRMSSDAVAISGSTDAADKLEASAETIVIGTVSHDNTAATTTVFYSDDITEATADHFNGRIVIFTSGDLIRQATDITDYELSAGEGKFTVTALTEAPADNVTFVIV